MSFKKNKYTVIKNAIPINVANFCMNYLQLKKKVYDTYTEWKYISPYNKDHGFYEGEQDQIPNTWSCYGDIAMETLLSMVKPIMEKNTHLKLYETYAYTRLYKKGDELKKHSDRSSCEISTTLHLGGDRWPIYLKNIKNKTVKVELNISDMLIYKGCELEHWREPFTGNICGQVFLHYNEERGTTDDQLFDTRPHLGLPSFFIEPSKFTREPRKPKK